MERINRLIRKTIFEIAICIAIVIISIPIWKSFDLEEYETVAASFNNMNLIDNSFEVSDLSSYILYQTSDEDAIEIIEPILISYDMNNSDTYLVISKNSSLDYRSLKINYDGVTTNASDMEIREESEYYYIPLKAEEKAQIHNLKIWIDSKSNYNTYDKRLIFSIENRIKQDL